MHLLKHIKLLKKKSLQAHYLIDVYEGEIPRLSKNNSHKIEDDVFWIQRAGTTNVFIAWHKESKKKICATITRDKLIRKLDEKWKKEQHRL